MLYLFLFSIVKRADRVISAQSEEVRLANEAMLRHQAYHDVYVMPTRRSPP